MGRQAPRGTTRRNAGRWRGLLLYGLLSCFIPASGLAKPLPHDQKARILTAIANGSGAVADSAMKDQTIEAEARRLGSVVAVTEFVQRKSRLVPYRGKLRGPSGVFADGEGNSLDRALLLARMLVVLGSEVRLARGSISEAAARKLLNEALSKSAGPGNKLISDGARAAVINEAKDHEEDRQWLEEQFTKAEKVRRGQFDELFTMVETLNREVTPTLAKVVNRTAEDRRAAWERKAIETMQDHWWVQRKAERGWEDLEISTPDHRPLVSIYKTLAVDDVPMSDVHQLRIVVKVETSGTTGNRVSTVMEHRAPAADLAEGPLRFGHVALPEMGTQERDAILVGDEAKAAAVVRDHAWVPTLMVGQSFITQHSFTMNGTINEVSPSLMETLSGLKAGDAVRKGAKTATDLLAGLGGGDRTTSKAKEKPLVVAEWVEFEVSRPGEKTVRERRTIFDTRADKPRPGADGVHDAQVVGAGLQLLGSQVMQVSTAAFAPRRLIALANRGWSAMASVGAALFRDEKPSGAALASMQQFFPEVLGYEERRDAMQDARSAVYRDRPQVVSMWSTPVRATEGLRLSVAFDIVAHGVGVLPQRGGDPAALRMSQGLIDSVVETGLTPGGRSTAERHVLAVKEGRSWGVLDCNALAGIPESTIRAPLEAACNDHLVVVGDKTDPSFWWRIDPESGELLGMGPGGRGISETEYVLLLSTAMCVHDGLKSLWLGNGDRVISDIVGMTFCAAGALAGTGGPVLQGLGATVTAVGYIIMQVPDYRAAF